MAEQSPAWRQSFDELESALAPPIKAVLGSREFATGLTFVLQVRKAVVRQTERTTRRVLHALNQPAASDVNRLLVEVHELQRDVRRLANQLRSASSVPPGEGHGPSGGAP